MNVWLDETDSGGSPAAPAAADPEAPVKEQEGSFISLTEDAAAPDEITAPESAEVTEETAEADPEPYLDPDGAYTSKDDVALYLYLYGELPDNFITKDEARDLGWPGGNLQPYAPGKSIGGDYFGNYEGKLPKRKGLSYHECDIDTMGKKSRGSKRLIYGTDGSIYYTDDHYESFEMLYGGEG
ncbi:MAG: ribonuclease [Lachnospiraceae bacterium]|nr:ribonuclease [Lachnospiraceae bacterium]